MARLMFKDTLVFVLLDGTSGKQPAAAPPPPPPRDLCRRLTTPVGDAEPMPPSSECQRHGAGSKWEFTKRRTGLYGWGQVFLPLSVGRKW